MDDSEKDITTVGLAEKDGVSISFVEYARFAAPMTAITVLLASAFLVGYVVLGTPTVHVVAWSAVVALLAIEVVRGFGPARRASTS